jgi:hypothetical protein
MSETEISALVCRVDRLETRLRRARLLGAASLGALLLLGSLGATGPSDEIRTKSLIVVDRDGKSRAGFTVGPDGTVLLGFLDANRRTRASIFVGDGGAAGLALADATGKPRVRLDSPGNETGRWGLIVNDPSEKPRAEVVVSPDGNPSLRLSDGTGKELFAAPQPVAAEPKPGPSGS